MCSRGTTPLPVNAFHRCNALNAGGRAGLSCFDGRVQMQTLWKVASPVGAWLCPTRLFSALFRAIYGRRATLYHLDLFSVTNTLWLYHLDFCSVPWEVSGAIMLSVVTRVLKCSLPLPSRDMYCVVFCVQVHMLELPADPAQIPDFIVYLVSGMIQFATHAGVLLSIFHRTG